MKRIILMVIRLLYIAPYWFIKLLHMAGSDQYSWKEKKTKRKKLAKTRSWTAYL